MLHQSLKLKNKLAALYDNTSGRAQKIVYSHYINTENVNAYRDAVADLYRNFGNSEFKLSTLRQQLRDLSPKEQTSQGFKDFVIDIRQLKNRLVAAGMGRDYISREAYGTLSVRMLASLMREYNNLRGDQGNTLCDSL